MPPANSLMTSLSAPLSQVLINLLSKACAAFKWDKTQCAHWYRVQILFVWHDDLHDYNMQLTCVQKYEP